MRRVLGSLLLLLAAPVAMAASGIETGAGAAVARAAVDFAIAIPRVMQLRLLGHPLQVEITGDDIARGKLTVSGASLDLLVNNPLGYALRAEVASAAFSAVRINLPARMPSMVGRPRPAPIAVEYELEIAPGTAPGRYAWPVALTLQEP